MNTSHDIRQGLLRRKLWGSNDISVLVPMKSSPVYKLHTVYSRDHSGYKPSIASYHNSDAFLLEENSILSVCRLKDTGYECENFDFGPQEVFDLDVRSDNERWLVTSPSQISSVDVIKNKIDWNHQVNPTAYCSKYSNDDPRTIAVVSADNVILIDTRMRQVPEMRPLTFQSPARKIGFVSDLLWMGDMKLGYCSKSSGELQIYDARKSIKPYCTIKTAEGINSICYDKDSKIGYCWCPKANSVKLFTYNGLMGEWSSFMKDHAHLKDSSLAIVGDNLTCWISTEKGFRVTYKALYSSSSFQKAKNAAEIPFRQPQSRPVTKVRITKRYVGVCIASDVAFIDYSNNY